MIKETIDFNSRPQMCPEHLEKERQYWVARHERKWRDRKAALLIELNMWNKSTDMSNSREVKTARIERALASIEKEFERVMARFKEEYGSWDFLQGENMVFDS